jgi:multidrug efflux pump subunit AcrA (membrane-fusion protein)
VAYVPDEAVRRNGTEATAWIVDQGRSAATLRQVQVSDSGTTGWAMVTAGLQAGDRVIVGDVSHLAEGKRIRVMGEAPAPPGMIAENVKGAGHGTH